MLITNYDQRKQAHLHSLRQLCPKCSQELADYPLIQLEDEKRTTFHASCAMELAMGILADVSDLVPPPQPSQLSAMTEAFRRARAARGGSAEP